MNRQYQGSKKKARRRMFLERQAKREARKQSEVDILEEKRRDIENEHTKNSNY